MTKHPKRLNKKKIEAYQQGALGEWLVSDGLAKLPLTYRLFRNLIVPVNPGTGGTLKSTTSSIPSLVFCY